MRQAKAGRDVFEVLGCGQVLARHRIPGGVDADVWPRGRDEAHLGRLVEEVCLVENETAFAQELVEPR